MDWLGIGVFILAIGFAVFVYFFIPVLKGLSMTLNKTADTVETSRKSIEELSGETKILLSNTNETLADMNNKMTQLDPLFKIIHDTGESAHHLTSSLVKFTGGKADNVENASAILDKNQLQGLIRGIAFLYYLRQRKNS